MTSRHQGRWVCATTRLGIGLFSAITATVTSYLLSTGDHNDRTRAGRLVEELERLAVLREQGSLTDDEFGAAKEKVLHR